VFHNTVLGKTCGSRWEGVRRERKFQKEEHYKANERIREYLITLNLNEIVVKYTPE
jgi:hypothetical protein